MSLPTGTVYGSRVSSSGDKIVKDVNMRSLYLVKDFTSGESSDTTSSYFMYDPLTLSSTETTRITYSVDGTKEEGSTKIEIQNASEMLPTISTMATKSTITSENVESFFEPTGISFSSDDSAIFFGSSKTFRIKFLPSDDSPRLVFQYLDESSGDYITKTSIL